MYALSSGNVTKYECLPSKDVLPEKDLLEKAAAIKRFEYLPLGEELKTKSKSNLVYSKEFAFYKYHSAKQLPKRSFYSK